MILLSPSKSLTLGSTWSRYMKLPDMDQISFNGSPASKVSFKVVEDPSDSGIGRCRTKVDVLSSWSPPEVLIRASAIGKINSPSLGNYTSVVLLQSSVDEQRWADSMALMHNNSMVVLHKICEIPRICLYERLSVLLMARETSFNSLPSFRNFGCARMWLCALSGEILHHDCVSVVVSKFAFWTLWSAETNHLSFFFEVLLRQCVFCTEPLSHFAISIFWKMG